MYEASYEAVESAVENDKPLLGSLYWKWAVPGLEKGEWREGAGSSTARHSVPQHGTDSQLRMCLDSQRVCMTRVAP